MALNLGRYLQLHGKAPPPGYREDDADDTGDAGPPDPRPPRRLERFLALDDAIEAFMRNHLDRIDRKAPLPAATVAGVNRLLALAAPALARAARHDRPPPFPLDRPVMPADAFIALCRVRAVVDAVFGARLAALEDDGPPW